MPARRIRPGRILGVVGLGIVSGLILVVGLAYAVSGTLRLAPPAPADVCDGIPADTLNGAGPGGVTRAQYCAEIDRILELPLGGTDGFEGVFAEPDPPSDPALPRPGYLIWESDGCSAPVLGSGPFDFGIPCGRHDFAWRNIQALDDAAAPVWTVDNKDRADAGFLFDMRTRCAAISPAWRIGCDTTARIYYTAVRLNPAGARDVADVMAP